VSQGPEFGVANTLGQQCWFVLMLVNPVGASAVKKRRYFMVLSEPGCSMKQKGKNWHSGLAVP